MSDEDVATISEQAAKALTTLRNAYDALAHLREVEIRALESDSPKKHQSRLIVAYIKAVETNALYNQQAQDLSNKVVDLA